MVMYAIGTQPMICRLDGIAKQVWYADDSAAGSSLERLRRWWDWLREIGPLYGYSPNGSKTHVLAKSQHIEAAREIFKDTGIFVSIELERYLGGAMDTISFLQQYVERKVDGWVKELEKLSKIAATQPHHPTLPSLMASLQSGITLFNSLTGKHSHPLTFSSH